LLYFVFKSFFNDPRFGMRYGDLTYLANVRNDQ